jgi:CelD/BcsL family acetyltransferase involved in cellulose biosynthesis
MKSISQKTEFSVSVFSAREIEHAFIQKWQDLASHAVQANVYLTPDFVIPALTHLQPSDSVDVVSVERVARSGNELVGLGLIHSVPFSRSIPFRHAELYKTRHSAATGFLLHHQYADSVFRVLLKKMYSICRVVETIHLQQSDEWQSLFNSNSDTGSGYWIEYERFDRAILDIDLGGEDYIHQILSKKRRNNFNRHWRKLSKSGKIEWRLIRGDVDWPKHIAIFLNLENLGWKGIQSTSLVSRDNDRLFFQEMIMNFAKHEQLFFTELHLDGRPIASTVNLVHNRTGFGFKLAWDPQNYYASPGILNIVELIRHAPELLSDLDTLDSASLPGSFSEAYFINRIPIVSGTVTRNAGLKFVLDRIQNLRHLNHQLEPWKTRLNAIIPSQRKSGSLLPQT